MSTALLRFVRLSPTKARLVAREIQGMNAELALASLEFTPNKAAKLIAKVLASAVANGNYEASNVAVASCRIDTGPVLRRFTPRARGRATPIRKPTSHIFVEVAEMTDKKPKNSSKRGKKVAQSEDK
ncbi:MAG: 50S ribosomal protein L22 [Helicobacter sp.]|nr:50S ribosomal protein L22 [Helicobacter sp.]MDE5815933.1 50S ribosomal protein L22 [Helicobacter sp.]MDE6044781.1 50S ribosomal protein L22 [Helicobacter sp.]MDE7197067.1 50S ribosomal protein L22 [Helicobacter sp.]MDE7448228.1 50S ribosomal protein L22 [Helicobacter sp.]